MVTTQIEIDQKEVIEAAKKQFPKAENELVAVDMYAQKIFREYRLNMLPHGYSADDYAKYYLGVRAVFFELRDEYAACLDEFQVIES